MKSLFEELGGTYTLGKDDMYYPNLTIDDNDQRPVGKWGRMHKAYLEEVHPGLYERLILNGSLHRHLADANERAEAMMELLTKQMKARENITEQLKAEQPMVWVGRMNSI
ncbi:MAG: TnpV protein, partial [Clostridia bacterium]|nr:TnpV protein [Clostridia bacterium]